MFNQKRHIVLNRIAPVLVICIAGSLAGCATVKYNTLEKFGIHKRDILVDNVADARDAQQEAQQQFKDALERFGSVVNIEETGLKKAYDRLSDEYEDSKDAADEVSEQIDDVEAVATALFREWEAEIDQYTNADLKRNSQNQYRTTQARYKEMLLTMQDAERSMAPVLATFKDNVLFLKHNLNAQAVGSLQNTFSNLQNDIDNLIRQMNLSIERSNQFIAEMRPA